MKRRKALKLMLLTGMFFTFPTLGRAQGTTGLQMLTTQERERMRLRLLNAESEEERQRIREEYRLLNQDRMKGRKRLNRNTIPGSGRSGGGGGGGGRN